MVWVQDHRTTSTEHRILATVHERRGHAVTEESACELLLGTHSPWSSGVFLIVKGMTDDADRCSATAFLRDSVIASVDSIHDIAR